ncbi:MAG: hypothetical protein ACR2PA_06680, partial [Hyphomicrobiaceae bacterium]
MDGRAHSSRDDLQVCQFILNRMHLVPAVLLCCLLLSACGQRLPPGTVFEQLVYDEQQGAKPKPTGDIKTEYPLPENWGPRISEYRGDPTI